MGREEKANRQVDSIQDREFVNQRLITQTILSKIIKKLSRSSIRQGDSADMIIYKRDGLSLIINDEAKIVDTQFYGAVEGLYSSFVNVKEEAVYVPLSDDTYLIFNKLRFVPNAKLQLEFGIPFLTDGFFVSMGIGTDRQSVDYRQDKVSELHMMSGRTIVCVANKVAKNPSVRGVLSLSTLEKLTDGSAVGNITIDKKKFLRTIVLPDTNAKLKTFGQSYQLFPCIARDLPAILSGSKRNNVRIRSVIDEDPDWRVYGDSPQLTVDRILTSNPNVTRVK